MDFVERTDVLARSLDCDVQDLTGLLGFSRASLFAYRSGKAQISAKAWAKLTEAEVKTLRKRGFAYPDEVAGSVSSRVQEPADPPIQDRVDRLEAEIAELRAVVLKIRNAMNQERREGPNK